MVSQACPLPLGQQHFSPHLDFQTSKVPCLTPLLCSLLLAAAYRSFFSAQHVPGVDYLIGDAVSLWLTGI